MAKHGVGRQNLGRQLHLSPGERTAVGTHRRRGRDDVRLLADVHHERVAFEANNGVEQRLEQRHQTTPPKSRFPTPAPLTNDAAGCIPCAVGANPCSPTRRKRPDASNDGNRNRLQVTCQAPSTVTIAGGRCRAPFGRVLRSRAHDAVVHRHPPWCCAGGDASCVGPVAAVRDHRQFVPRRGSVQPGAEDLPEHLQLVAHEPALADDVHAGMAGARRTPPALLHASRSPASTGSIVSATCW